MYISPYIRSIIRLCDVSPTDSSTLISFYLLNLTHRDGRAYGHQHVEALTPGQYFQVEVELKAASYVVPKGHCLRLAVSPSYWPTAWPAKDKTQLTILTGKNPDSTGFLTCLLLPIFKPNAKYAKWGTSELGQPQLGPALPIEIYKAHKYKLSAKIGLSDAKHKWCIKDTFCKMYIPATDTVVEETCKKYFRIREDDPLSAKATVEHWSAYK